MMGATFVMALEWFIYPLGIDHIQMVVSIENAQMDVCLQNTEQENSIQR